MSTIRTAIFVTLVFAVTGVVHGFEIQDYNARLQAAEAKGTPLLVEFTTKKCGSCRKFEAAFHTEQKMQDAVSGIVTTKVTSWSTEGAKLVEAHRIVAYPTFLLVDNQGREIDRWIGWQDRQTWLDLVTASLADLSLISEMQHNDSRQVFARKQLFICFDTRQEERK